VNIEDVSSNISFEETEKGVIMFIDFTHPDKTTGIEGVDGKFPLTAQMFFEFDKESTYYKSIESFFR